MSRFVLRSPGFPFRALDGLRADATPDPEERRAALWDLAARPLVQEAIWLSNPAVFDNELSSSHATSIRSSKIKRRERRLYTYLQRLAAKNDTTSFFGPLNYGRFGDEPEFELGAERITRRRGFVAFRAVAELAERIGAEPELLPHLRPRRDPLRDADDPVLGLCDGEATVADLCERLSLSPEAISDLAAAGRIRLGPHIPESEVDPLGRLRAELDRMPDHDTVRRWSAELTALADLAVEFAGTPWPERRAVLDRADRHYARLTGQAARAGDGRMFRDRTLLYEECRGDVERFTLGAAQADVIVDALGPVLDLCASYGSLVQDDLQSAGRALYDRLGGGRPVSFPRFVATWRREYPQGTPTPRADRLRDAFTALVPRTAGTAALSADDVRALCPPSPDPVVASPDLMIAAHDFAAIAAGEFKLVLGEVHHGIQPAGWMLSVADDADEWQAELAEHNPAGSANLVFRRRMKLAPPEFPGPSVQLSGTAANADRIDASSLRVALDGDRLVLRRGEDGCAIRFRPPTFGIPFDLFAVFECFSYPTLRPPVVRLGDHTPRVEIGGLVYQRRRWELASAHVPGRDRPADLLAGATALRERFDLPERVFVRSPAEPKPVYIDLANPFAVELLAVLARGCDRLVVEEMLPGPEDLWLHREDGPYCAELRMVMSRGGGAGR
ncbi:MAG: hypothetical protein HOV94_32840 [Saccharothrix sp.]|nr:hypothetical protein [Saccharothrix sp.]